MHHPIKLPLQLTDNQLEELTTKCSCVAALCGTRAERSRAHDAKQNYLSGETRV